MRTEWTLLFPLIVLWASAQDQNFGKRVKCYMVEGIAMCPGCNSRAGLICPRVIPDENKCDEPPPVTKAPVDERTRKDTTPTPTPLSTTVAIETTQPMETSTIARTTLEVPINPEGKVGGEFAKPTPIDMQIFLYQVLQNSNNWKRPYLEIPRRLRRDAAEETCQWNGDCPCPQICCGNGDNKPKTCKRGIRLPPPWGG